MIVNLSRTLSAVAAAAAVAAVITVLPGASEQVSANAPFQAPASSQCTAQAWPHYDASCIRDTREVSGQARQVRVIR